MAALLAVGATAGFFAVAGADLAVRVLGDAYGDDVGTEIARLVVAFAPYMVVSVVLSVTFPLVFVAGLGRRLPLVGLVVLVAHVPLALAGQRLCGLWGLALALAASTALAAGWLLHLLRRLAPTLRGSLLPWARPCLWSVLAFAPVALLDHAALAGGARARIGHCARRGRAAERARGRVALPPGAGVTVTVLASQCASISSMSSSG